MPDHMRVEDLDKDGKFVDDNGNEQLAVPLSSIFNIINSTQKQQQPLHQEPHKGKKKPTGVGNIGRGIKLPK